MTIPPIFLLALPSAPLAARTTLGAGAQDFARQLGECYFAVGELKAGLRDAEERTGVLVPPAAPASGMNLGKRTQALRMSRRGKKPEQIATALNLPRKEVELLVKVHRMRLCIE